MKKRLLSMLVVLTMVLSMLSVAAFAATPPRNPQNKLTISVLLNSQNSSGEIEFPNEPGTSTGDYYYINSNYQLEDGGWSVIWFANGNADTYLDTSQTGFWDNATWSRDGSACGIYDPQGLSLIEPPFKGNIDGNKIIQAWINYTKAKGTVDDYELIVYVAKYVNDSWFGEGYHVDCVVVPKDNVTLSYDGNLPSNTDAEVTLPSQVSVAKGENVTVGKLTTTEIKADGDTYNFTGWNTQANGKGTSYAAGSTIVVTDDTTLYAQWKPQHTHDWGEWKVTTEPTCTTPGEETRICTLNEEHVETRPVAIDEDAHEWGEWEVTTEPTCTTPGEETRICELNDKHFETRPVDAKGHTWDDNWVDNGDLTETRTCSNNVCTETRDIDKKGKLEGGKETGDGIADKYQVFVWYKAGANGSLEGKTYYAYDLRINGTTELRSTVSLTYPTTVPYSGYAFDKWILPAQVTINGTTMSNFQVGTTYTFTATFGTDSKGNLDGDKETGDGTPDKYQVFVWYKADNNGSLEGKTYYAYDLRINGTTELRSTVSLNYPTPVARHGFDFDGWLEPADVVISEDTMSQFTVGETYVFTAMFSRDRGDRPVAEPTVKVKGLNSDDHVAYVVGRGEGMFDPMGKVTRAEVATIYFRLMTEEFRTEFWTDVNSFSDVVGTDWYNVAISTLENAGVIQDTVTGGEFRPNDPITRAELAVMAAQFATVTGKIPETSFKDVDKDYWAYDEIKLIECAGWIEGYRSYFRPDDNLTRAECVTIVNRMLKRGAEEDNMLEDMVIFLDNLDQDMWYYEAIQEAANSHDYTRTKVKLEGENFNGEIWTVLLDAPDWAALEQAWSQAHVE